MPVPFEDIEDFINNFLKTHPELQKTNPVLFKHLTDDKANSITKFDTLIGFNNYKSSSPSSSASSSPVGSYRSSSPSSFSSSPISSHRGGRRWAWGWRLFYCNSCLWGASL